MEQEVLTRLGMIDDEQKHNTVKRRIYDALSTFLALNILQKQDKTLYWRGFPIGDQINTSILSSPSVHVPEPKEEESSCADCGAITEDFINSATAEDIQKRCDDFNVEIQ